jgi:hypothetical protein
MENQANVKTVEIAKPDKINLINTPGSKICLERENGH